MPYIVRQESVNPIPTVVVRRKVRQQELSKVVPECCGVVWNAIRAQQIKGAGRHVALYLDDAMNIEVGVELSAQLSGEGGVVNSSLPGGVVLTTTHFGPYGQLHAAHQAIHDWCKANNIKLAGPSWEIYGHWDNAWNDDPLRIRTDVYYLLGDGK